MQHSEKRERKVQEEGIYPGRKFAELDECAPSHGTGLASPLF
jgi:hypothetical protein